MAEKKKRKRLRIPFPKINDDFMTTAVVFSLLYCVRVVEKSLNLAAMGQDASGTVVPALAVFGTELALCALMKMHDRNIAKEDKKAEEAQRKAEAAQKKREERRLKEEQEKEAFLKGGIRNG